MAHPLVRLADGTVRQVGPLTGTQVWTIPGRSHRPLPVHSGDGAPPAPEDPEHADDLCAFCPARYLETTPEKSRLVRRGQEVLVSERRSAPRLSDDVADVRRFANLFEIVPAASWRTNHGFVAPADVAAWARDYLADPVGREHVLALTAAREAAGGVLAPAAGDEAALARVTEDFMAGSHDVVVARRHLRADARTTADLAAAGTLTPLEHADFIDFTVEALRDTYARQPAARYVSVFQNWLRAAGATFDHLHKQLVGIDAHGPQTQREIAMLREEPDLYNRAVIDLVRADQLVIASNDGAVAVAGVGHRHPSIEIYSTAPVQLPWEHDAAQRRAVSDLLHAMHAATGPQVATNEEWHHRPPDVVEPMPWRIVLKWRLQVPAGFEGGTKIYVNTIDPWAIKQRMTQELLALRESGAIAPLRIGTECSPDDADLRYARG
ncbi:DUF4921 family protein [Litorihabitans aurantiacus]|uniref:DUF4921 domain-containing protein n=1 Tax=Litorihabitans aurantiacus TaxID=1930061 RepID=A0AA37XD29_9MICO|nr:DUF4921 family protein [Litorihabitans aurantiacus]GMA30735.1 hypothetical protein GCM10025875_07270 [Litorihabitans aurantiacus]